jgi:hypothetical protein
MMKHLERLLSLLDGVKQTGKGYTARCPVHGRNGSGDKNPSLNVSLGEDNKILIHCFAGCTHDAILDELGLEARDLWPVEGDTGAIAETVIKTEAVTPDAGLCAEVYQTLLSNLALTEGHRKQLHKRGLNDEQIDRFGYRSLTFFEFKKVVTGLRKQFGQQLLKVPGFTLKKGTITTVELPNGLLIPVRDTQGRIVAMQIRCDRADEGGKYRWFSGGEISSGSPAHVPVGVGPAELIRVTEGPLKADVAFALDGVPTVGIAGVSSWRAVLPVLELLKPTTVRLAFDADAGSKRGVATALAECCDALKERYAVQLDVWAPDKGKGLDDLLAAGGKATVLSGSEVGQHLDKLLGGGEVQTPADDEPVGTQPPVRETPPVKGEAKGPERFPYGAGDPAPFPLDFFPKPLQGIAQAISRAVNSPLDFAGCAMAITAATAIGRSRQLEPKEDWHICPRMYMAVVCEPGSAKSPALKKATRPLNNQERQWRAEHAEAMQEYELEKLAYEAAKKEILKDVSKKVQQAQADRQRKARQEEAEEAENAA